MPSPAAVLSAIDAVPELRVHNPILFARMSRAGADCGQLRDANLAIALGANVPGDTYLDSPDTVRRARRRHAANRAARRARRANR